MPTCHGCLLSCGAAPARPEKYLYVAALCCGHPVLSTTQHVTCLAKAGRTWRRAAAFERLGAPVQRGATGELLAVVDWPDMRGGTLAEHHALRCEMARR